MNRRKLLKVGTASLVILGGTGYAALRSDISRAREPWAAAGQGFDDPRLNALSYAILAPSPHNRQPWLIQLEGEDAMTVFCDMDRLLPETDPLNRQIVVGFGAFLELLRMAAAQENYDVDVRLFPEGEPQPQLDNRPIAKIHFTKNVTQTIDPLFEFVPARRTNRLPFENKTVERALLAGFAKTQTGKLTRYGFTEDESHIATLRDLCLKGWATEIQNSRTHQESTRLTRVGAKAVNADPDGISLSGPMMEALRLTGTLTAENMNDKTSTAFKETKKFYDGLIETAQAFSWISTIDNSRVSQIEAGMNWLRLHLAATREGLAFQPLSQILQEYPEMAEYYDRVHSMLGVEQPGVIQGLFRLGYAKAPPPAPRWPLESRLMDA
jgi:hypothetical protein